MRGKAPGGVVKLLLDGQQRVTSLYGIVQGSSTEFFQGNAKAFTDLHFNVKTETFEFYGPVKMRDDPLWISVTEIFQGPVTKSCSAACPTMSRTAASMTNAGSRLGIVRDIREIDLHDEEITGKDHTIDEVVEIFNRVNSGGTKLSAGDLALARICADGRALAARFVACSRRGASPASSSSRNGFFGASTSIATTRRRTARCEESPSTRFRLR